jgi:hypothetical protein
MTVLRGASERPIFNQRFCGASEAIYFQREFMWRDKKWRVLDETRSMSVLVARLSDLFSTNVFVARLKPYISNEHLRGAIKSGAS